MGALASPWASRVPMQFLCPDDTSLSVTGSNSLINNPYVFYVQPGNVPKIELGINGATYFRGDGEYAPFAIDLEWKQIAYTDYEKLAALRPYFINMVTFRNIGYYGKLIMEGPKSDKPYAGDVISTKGTFYVLSPSDAGGAIAVNRLAVPTTLASTLGAANSGYIAAGTLYYWLTYSSIWGETTTQEITVTTTNASSSVTLNWSWPTSTFCTHATLYCANVNDPGQSKLMAQVLNGENASWVDLVGFNGCIINQQPPLSNTAYRGQWNGGIWKNEA